MTSITTIPKEIVLKVTKIFDLRTAINLLSTCKTLYEIIHLQWFWIDQLHRLYWLFQPQLPLHLESLSVQELMELATTPYRFEQRAIRGELSDLPLLHVNLGVGFGYIAEAKLVPGGEWLITLSVEREQVQHDADGPFQKFVRLWSISSPAEENINCVAKLELPPEITPNKACLQHGDDDLDLLVFVTGFQPQTIDGGGFISYIKVFLVQLGDENPQFSLVADLETDRHCTGLAQQNGTINVVVDEIEPARTDGMNWNWKTGVTVQASGLEPGDTEPCYIIISEPLSVTWNAMQCTIDVRWSSTSDRPGKVDNYVPDLSESFPDISQSSQMFPVLGEIRTPHGDTHQIAVINLERESILVEVEKLGTGDISFTRYAKENSYMKNPYNPEGNFMERPYDIVRTVNGHLIDMAPSGRLTMFLAPASDHRAQTEIGDSVSRSAYQCNAAPAFPLMCPFAGVIGYVTHDCELFIWRMSEENP